MEFDLQYEASVSDSRHLARHIWSRPALKLLLLSVAMLIITSLLAFRTDWQWIFFACVGIVVFILLLVIFMRIQFERTLVAPVKQMTDPLIHVTFSEEIIRKKSQFGEVSIPWTIITKVEETTGLLVLYQGAQVLFAIPSSILTEPIRSLIISKAPKYKGQKP